ncbi:MAG TPA: DoxX-like family protein [Pyrinomonadaceae bacterium]
MVQKQSDDLATRFRSHLIKRMRFFKSHLLFGALQLATAAVWLLFGMWFKVLGMVPRHRLIAAAILGEAVATPVIMLVGIAEIAIALWIVSGIYPRFCAIVQSIAIVTMNALELSIARELLLAPVLMVVANTIFLGVVWYCALKIPTTQAET